MSTNRLLPFHQRFNVGAEKPAIRIDAHSKSIEYVKDHPRLVYNASVAELYELAIQHPEGVEALPTTVVSSGAMAAYSGSKTGRTPSEKRIIDEPSSSEDVWWGPVNIKLDEHSYLVNRIRAVDYLNTRPLIYIVDGFAGWDPEHRIKVRVVTSRAYHALFMHNMLIRPTMDELKQFDNGPDYTIFNGGEFPSNILTPGMTSTTSVDVHFGFKEMVILGTQYAGEMKKGVFSIMHYLMPKQGVLSLHSSANQGRDGDVTLLFGLSGTGKTTLSADPHRALIGDDEHCWSDNGVFNIEGGCYAKCIGLSVEKEPEIFNAIKFGSVLENTVFDPHSREVDFNDSSITENTRCSYPIEYMPNVKLPCVGGHPKNIIFLTCDAFGVLPPVSYLDSDQAMYHFMSGYTAKVAGTEVGVKEPTATFSACFGEAFLILHPTLYAEMLAEKMQKHGAKAWLVNTGWSGGAYGEGERMSLKYTRAIIDAIHNGELDSAETQTLPIFNLKVPKTCSNVPSEILLPSNTWSDAGAYNQTLTKLANMFVENFKKYEDRASTQIKNAGPTL